MNEIRINYVRLMKKITSIDKSRLPACPVQLSCVSSQQPVYFQSHKQPHHHEQNISQMQPKFLPCREFRRHLLHHGVRHWHRVRARAVDGVRLQSVTIFGVPHLRDDPHRVALDVFTHKGGVVQINAVAVVLHEAQGVGVVLNDRHIFLRFAADHHNRQNYSKYQIFHSPSLSSGVVILLLISQAA